MTSRIRHFPAFCQNESANSQMWYRLLLRKTCAHLSSKMKIRYIVYHYKIKNILEYEFARRMRCMFSERKTIWICGYFHWKWHFCNILPTLSSRHMTKIILLIKLSEFWITNIFLIWLVRVWDPSEIINILGQLTIETVPSS